MKYILLLSLLAINFAHAGTYEKGIKEAKKEIISHIDEKIEEIRFSLNDADSQDSQILLYAKINTYYYLKFFLKKELDNPCVGFYYP